jgi:hypothetical protein
MMNNKRTQLDAASGAEKTTMITAAAAAANDRWLANHQTTKLLGCHHPSPS